MLSVKIKFLYENFKNLRSKLIHFMSTINHLYIYTYRKVVIIYLGYIFHTVNVTTLIV